MVKFVELKHGEHFINLMAVRNIKVNKEYYAGAGEIDIFYINEDGAKCYTHIHYGKTQVDKAEFANDVEKLQKAIIECNTKN